MTVLLQQLLQPPCFVIIQILKDIVPSWRVNYPCCNSDFSDDGRISSIIGSAQVRDPAEPAKLEVYFYESKALIRAVMLSVHSWWILQQPKTSELSHSLPSGSLLGAVHRLRRSRSGLRLHAVRPRPRRVVLDPEQKAHLVQGDHGATARHPDLCRGRRGQNGLDQSGWDLLQGHEPVAWQR